MATEIAKPILRRIDKWDVRVLRPSEYKAIWNASKKYKYQVILDTLLLTAGRITELKEMEVNNQWFDFDGRNIHIREHKAKRLERGVKDRYIHLSIKGVEVVRNFINNKYYIPSYQAIIQNLKRWAKDSNIDTTALGGKVFRKTYESWLIFYYPDKAISILQSTGHTQEVAMEHYLNMPFTEKDKVEMKEYVEGWM